MTVAGHAGFPPEHWTGAACEKNDLDVGRAALALCASAFAAPAKGSRRPSAATRPSAWADVERARGAQLSRWSSRSRSSYVVPQEVTVAYVTANGTAPAGDDYWSPPRVRSRSRPGSTVRRGPGERSPWTGSTSPIEAFALNLSNPVGVSLGGCVAIADDREWRSTPADRRWANGVRGAQGGGTPRSATPHSSPSSCPTTKPVTVDYTTADFTVHAGLDYQAASGTITFPVSPFGEDVAFTILGQPVNELYDKVLRDPVERGERDDPGPRRRGERSSTTT